MLKLYPFSPLAKTCKATVVQVRGYMLSLGQDLFADVGSQVSKGGNAVINQVFLWRWPKMQEPTEKKEQAPFRILEAILTNCLIEEKSSFHVEKKLVRWQQTVVSLNGTWWPVCCTSFMSYRSLSSPVSVHSGGRHPHLEAPLRFDVMYFIIWGFFWFLDTFANLIVLWFMECPTPPSEFVLGPAKDLWTLN